MRASRQSRVTIATRHQLPSRMETLPSSQAISAYEGIYAPPTAARYLLAARTADRAYPVTSRHLIRWIRNGMAHLDLSDVPGRDLTIAFQDLVSMRVIASLRAAGVSWPRIRAAEAWLRRHTGCQRPFATEQLWTDQSDVLQLCPWLRAAWDPRSIAPSRTTFTASPVQIPNGRRFKPARLPRSPRESPFRGKPARSVRHVHHQGLPHSRQRAAASRIRSPANGRPSPASCWIPPCNSANPASRTPASPPAPSRASSAAATRQTS